MARLRRSDPHGPGIGRRGSGARVRYLRPDGSEVRAPAELERLTALAVPPAWRDVWISPDERGHIQATGRDEAGRLQYRYHPEWRTAKDRLKHDRVLELAAVLPAVRRGLTRDLRREGLPRERVLAMAVRLLDAAAPRMGQERYREEHGSIGLTTVQVGHTRVSGSRIRLAFPGKSGQDWSAEVDDADLAEALRVVRRGRGAAAPLLAWRDGGRRRVLTPEEVNDDLRARCGTEVTAKDFRTLHGSLAAARSLAGSARDHDGTRRPSERSVRRAWAEAARVAAAELGNTPAVARSSYIDPRLLDRFRAGEVVDLGRGSPETALRELLAP